MPVLSVHLAKLSPATVRTRPRADAVEGLWFAELLGAARLAPGILPRPRPGRFGLVCVWEDDAAIDAYLAEHPFARAMQGGYGVRLEPLRTYGSCAGMGPLVEAEQPVADDEPLAVLTFGRTRLKAFPRFLRNNARASAAVLGSDALLASTGLARPPRTLATFSLWRDLAGMRAAVEGRAGAATGHRDAMRSRAEDPFHREDLFARFRPYAPYGLWDGRDPLAGTRAAVPVAA